MLLVQGHGALSEFRRSRLLARLRAVAPAVDDISAHFVYFVFPVRALDEPQHERLMDVLEAPRVAPATSQAGEVVEWLVTPRPGTISPWASKATDILHHSGLEIVERVERGVAYRLTLSKQLDEPALKALREALHDRMTETVLESSDEALALFSASRPAPLGHVELGEQPLAALRTANAALGLALSDDEIEYLAENYVALERNPTDAELMMFAQANSEHCRHKIFNASWIIDGQPQNKSLFEMIRNTYRHAPEGILSAYHDNSAVFAGPDDVVRFAPEAGGTRYVSCREPMHVCIKVETHNHPTAISPFPGAATGAGGEIRDEGATGRGARPKAGLTGFTVSNLRIPGFEQPWEFDYGKPARIVSALDIMLEGPIGGASFNNEFGRPGIVGYFRTYEQSVVGPQGREVRGYHKPIMLAGGVGAIRADQVDKQPIPPGAQVVVLGGPAMQIGLGGGAASSMTTGSSDELLDFASVQRSNPEMERRCQEVIDRCAAMGADSPVLSIHDVGAGGLSNAVPELMNDAGRGGRFELRAIPNDEPGMSPLAIWCNEAQERYVLAIDSERLDVFTALCDRERCPYAVIGEATAEQRLVVGDALLEETAVDMPMEVLLGKPPKMLREVRRAPVAHAVPELDGIEVAEAVRRVLRLPTVAGKGFLITIGDRTVGGLVARDQMVGPWQVPVADVGVTLSDFYGYTGEAMAIGERPPLALLSPAASGRMAIGEALTNLAASAVARLGDVRLSANWMAAAGHPGEDVALYETVRAVGEVLCPALGIAIPVGKDSMSMKTVWQADGETRAVTAPLSLVVSAFAPVEDVRRTLTPQLRRDAGDTDLVLVDLGKGHDRLGGSALLQVYGQLGHQAPDLDAPETLRGFFEAIQGLNRDGRLLAYHDRSDGGLLATLCEMAFAGRCGLDIDFGDVREPLASLFSEELGAVIQVRHTDVDEVLMTLEQHGLGHHARVIGAPGADDMVRIRAGGRELYCETRVALHRLWGETSYRMQALRDNPDCAEQEFASLGAPDDPGLFARLGFDPADDVAAPFIARGARPRVAILREQGVNGQIELAASFHRAGFEAVDVHMSDILEGRVDLSDFRGLAAGGGFSYGDVLGAGGGWAKSILFNPSARDAFEAFFNREDTFGIGLCNGCQMMSQLKSLIPGADHWPRFERNVSEQFEGRLSLVEVMPSPSILFADMQGAMMPVVVSHAEGRAHFVDNTEAAVARAGLVTLRFVDHHGHPTERYPENPNGSSLGVTGLCSVDGRFSIMMPHPERTFRSVQYSWCPSEWGEDSPWMRLFRNARVWVG
ncbi:phosphoribosylformylglycinamidine synthase [Acidihalobacter yilgarnensis]|uniref:Phosphoribosylformylglycinamidine synthase n=1 Tax=Acidihalobacter yilgarnensis TaxID=2819280 RepID=A0A1D8IN76_9GAMM|nr:phosphoribosylformylglycinamidine synthase [Acidihalobacter yilgarnensis]AOU97871.1 phosphoribosylformylglycinamidine synthase [Acidihalobacter yilgarnensis]